MLPFLLVTAALCADACASLDHQGRDEGFILPHAKVRILEELDRTGRFVLASKPGDMERYIWDHTDKCWRFHRTLLRVPRWKRLQDGRRLTEVRSLSESLPDIPRSPLRTFLVEK